MKKITLLILLALAALALTACAASSADSTEPAATPEPLVIDLDLSNMSGTVVYSQVYNLIYDPEPYIGKVIKMTGIYSAFEDYETNVIYHACLIPDAAACCAQGIEFVLTDEAARAWPEDYPEEGSNITVTGRLESYEEYGVEFLHLVDAVMEGD